MAATSVAYNGGVVLQALDAREEPDEYGLRLSLLGRLVRRRRWLFGTVISLIAFPLQIVAYDNAPIAVVQCGLAAGLVLILVVGSRSMGEPVCARDYAAIAAIVAGVAVAAAAAPTRGGAPRPGLVPLVVMAVIGCGALMPFALGRRSRWFPPALLIGSGFAFAWSDLATKLLADGFESAAWVIAGAWLAVVVLSALVATLCEMTAFQRVPATRVVPAVFVLETFVPILVAPTLLRVPFHPGSPSSLALDGALLLVLGAILVLSRSQPVTWLMRVTGAPERARDARRRGGRAIARTRASVSVRRAGLQGRPR